MSDSNDIAISLEEARALMGDEAIGISDEELQDLIDQLNSLARAYVQAVQSGYVMQSKHRV